MDNSFLDCAPPLAESARVRKVRDTPLMFPPAAPAARRAVDLKIGNRVTVAGREVLGVGIVLDLEPDGRLARVNFSGAHDGWWSRSDLMVGK